MKSEKSNLNSEWRPIEGFEDSYAVSTAGEVKSLDRIIIHERHGTFPVHERILKPGTDGWGYLFVYLRRDGKSHMRKVHRLVAMAFIPNQNKLREVNHIDGDKKNNVTDNLEWVTPKENQRHAFATGLNYGRSGKDNVKSKPIRQLSKEGNEVAVFESINQASKATKVLHSNIINCLSGKAVSNMAGGFRWELLNTNPITNQ